MALTFNIALSSSLQMLVKPSTAASDDFCSTFTFCVSFLFYYWLLYNIWFNVVKMSFVLSLWLAGYFGGFSANLVSQCLSSNLCWNWLFSNTSAVILSTSFRLKSLPLLTVMSSLSLYCQIIKLLSCSRFARINKVQAETLKHFHVF